MLVRSLETQWHHHWSAFPLLRRWKAFIQILSKRYSSMTLLRVCSEGTMKKPLNYRCSHVIFSRLYSKQMTGFTLFNVRMQGICVALWKQQKLSACRPRSLKDHQEVRWKTGQMYLKKGGKKRKNISVAVGAWKSTTTTKISLGSYKEE